MHADPEPIEELFAATPGALPWKRVVSCLAYWVDVANGDTELFKPAVGIDVEAYRLAVAAATGREVARVIFVNRSAAILRRNWLRDDPWDPLEDIFSTSFLTSLQARFGDGHPRHRLVDSIHDVDDSLWDGLWGSVMDSCWAPHLSRLWACPVNNLLACLYPTLAFALADDKEGFRRWRTFLTVQEGVLNLGFTRNDPTTFIALCA